MHPKTGRRRNAQPDGGFGRRAQTCVSMSTEYQERFLPPRCHSTFITTSTQKDPYHPLKSTSADKTTFRSVRVTHKWIKSPPKPLQPSMPPKGQQRGSSAPQRPVHFEAKQTASEVEDYTSVYQNDFRAWQGNKPTPIKFNDSLSLNWGLAITNSASKEGRSQKNTAEAKCKPAPQEQEQQPFERITSYRCDYVPHPVQPRNHKKKSAYQPTKVLPLGQAVSSKPTNTLDLNQDILDEASEFFQQCKTCSLGKTKESETAAEPDRFLSRTHGDFIAHQCQRTKPILPSLQNIEKSKEPIQTTTTMRDHYKAWDTPQRFPTARKKVEWNKKNTFSACTPQPADSSRTKPNPFSLHPKLNETAVCNDVQKVCSPAENTSFSCFECISNGTEETRRYWSASLDRGVTWADGYNISETPSESHQKIGNRVSSAN